jgi:hypothetical protein
MSPPPSVPDANRRVFEALFAIEAGLRELIIETLCADLGEQWFKSLPQDIKDKCNRGRLAEQSANWTTYVDHHPLYYADFPDLGKIINSKWNPHFKALFSDKDVLLASMRALEPTRNKVAHNRKVTDTDRSQVDTVLLSLQASIGAARFQSLVNRCTTAPDLGAVLAQLRSELDLAIATLESVAEPHPLTVWPQVRGTWWFDVEFLLRRTKANERDILDTRRTKLMEELKAVESRLSKMPTEPNVDPDKCPPDPIDAIRHLFDLYTEYSALPRGRGTGHILESWLRDESVHSIAARAGEAVRELTAEVTHG